MRRALTARQAFMPCTLVAHVHDGAMVIQYQVTPHGGPVVVDGERVGSIEVQSPPGGGAKVGYACVAWNGDLLSWHPTLAAALGAARAHWR